MLYQAAVRRIPRVRIPSFSISPLRMVNCTRDKWVIISYIYIEEEKEQLFQKVECVNKQIHDVYEVYKHECICQNIGLSRKT